MFIKQMGEELVKSVIKLRENLLTTILPIDLIAIICLILGVFLTYTSSETTGGIMISSVVFYYFGKRGNIKNAIENDRELRK